jgi:hypothetical protein
MFRSSFETTASVLDQVRMEVRVALCDEAKDQAVAALNAEHLQGAARTAGDSLWQLVYEGETLCAVVVWCACAFRLKARDAWIGWDDVTRARRLKLIVQNRRFLVVEAARRPNLASQCMGAALRVLPAQWQQQHGYLPLLAEPRDEVASRRLPRRGERREAARSNRSPTRRPTPAPPTK